MGVEKHRHPATSPSSMNMICQFAMYAGQEWAHINSTTVQNTGSEQSAPQQPLTTSTTIGYRNQAKQKLQKYNLDLDS